MGILSLPEKMYICNECNCEWFEDSPTECPQCHTENFDEEGVKKEHKSSI